MRRLLVQWWRVLCALARHDAEVRFRTRAGRGSAVRGVALLGKLERGFSK